jgi:hypothetical protein
MIYFTTLSVSQFSVASWDEWWIGKNLEERALGIIEVHSRKLLGRTETSHKNPGRIADILTEIWTEQLPNASLHQAACLTSTSMRMPDYTNLGIATTEVIIAFACCNMWNI